MDPNLILSKYEIEVRVIYLNIKKIIEAKHIHIYVKDQMLKPDDGLHYIIELMDPKRVNVDDYGIVVNFLIQIKNENVNVEIDVSKSYGPIYVSKTFDIKIINDNIDILALDESIDWINLLPDLAIKIYLQDYSTKS